jgi:ubiquinone biosynthesis protein
MTDRSYRLGDLARAREILSVMVRHGFGHFVSTLPLSRVPGLGRISSEGGEGGPADAPERLVRAMEELGPTFVKLGQMLSTRGDLLPSEYVERFATLQDGVPPFPGEDARAVIEADIGVAAADLFASFDEVPVASASIAQVHRAVLHDGRTVAVKVQRPGIEETIHSDLNILYVLADWLEGRIDLGVRTPAAIVEEFDRGINQEIDFRTEAANAENFAEAMADVEGVHVPRVHRQFTGRRVMIMEWVNGVRLSSFAECSADPERVLDRLVEATFLQIFVHGTFHGDPHPGNLLVDDESTLTYLDFGLVGRITPEMRDTLLALFVGVVWGDADAVARTLYRAAGGASGRVRLRPLSADVEELLQRYASTSFDEQDTAMIALDVLSLARRHGLGLPREYAILARACVTLDGIARTLVPDWNMMDAVRPYAARLAAERLDPESLSGEFLRSAMSAAGLMRDLPAQLDQLLLDLEGGNFEIVVRTPAVDHLSETVDRVGRSLIFGVGISAFLISAAILLGVLIPRAPSSGGLGAIELATAVGLALLLLAAFTLVGALVWSLFVAQRLQGVHWQRFFGVFTGGRARSNRDASSDPSRVPGGGPSSGPKRA